MRLIHWEALDILSKWTDNSIELILIDPPYNTIASKWDKYVDFNKFFDIAWKKLKPNGSIIVFASWSFTPRVMMSSINEYKYKYTWIKNNSTNFVHSKNRPMTKHEDILVFSKAPMGHISQIWEERRMIYNPQGLIKIDKKISWNNFGTIAW
jgi:23S rRNA G2069 N7-methylase RlmK/C1962 C5-methylase RlmI